MASSAFVDKAAAPDPIALAAELGTAYTLWCEMLEHVVRAFGPVDQAWVYSGKAYGWSLRLRRKGRAILYMTPLPSGMRVSFAFGERAVELARRSELPDSIHRLIDDAPRFPEGRAVRLAINDENDLRIAEQLAEIKMAG